MEDYDHYQFLEKAKTLVNRLLRQNKVVTNRHIKRFSANRKTQLDDLQDILEDDLSVLEYVEKIIAETKEKIEKIKAAKEEEANSIELAREYLKGSAGRCIQNKLDYEKGLKKCEECKICSECEECEKCGTNDCEECVGYYTSDESSDDSGTEYNTDDYDSDNYPDYERIDNYVDDDYNPNPHFQKIKKRLHKKGIERFKWKHDRRFDKDKIEDSYLYEELESFVYDSLREDFDDLYRSRNRKFNNLNWASNEFNGIEKEICKKNCLN